MPRTRARTPYPSDLTDAEWAVVAAAMPPAVHGRTGRPRTYALREVWNALLYLTRNGCAWRALPHDFPPWPVVWEHFRRWRDAGTLERVHAALREQTRVRAGRAVAHRQVGLGERADPRARGPRPDAEPRHRRQPVGADDGKGGPRGFDAGKQVKGRKRHLAVDTLGLLWAVAVHSAGIRDRDGARLMLAKLRGRLPRLAGVLADAGYNGPVAGWVRDTLGVPLTLVHKLPGQRGFQVLPRRLGVERTFGWLGRWRRLSKDDEQHPASGEAFVLLAMTRLLARRLAA